MRTLLRPVGRGGGGGEGGGGVRGGSHITSLHINSILPFESGPLVSLLLRITAIQTKSGCSYVSSFTEDQRGTRARKLFYAVAMK